MNQEWVRAKAAAAGIGWQWLYRCAPPPVHLIALGLLPAIHETDAGDAWPGEHDIGATVLRALNAKENAVLAKAGIRPTVGPTHKAVEKEAMNELKRSGLPLPHGAVHCDSTTDQHGRLHPYFVWFAAFEDDASGFDYYWGVLSGWTAEKGKRCRQVLLTPGSSPRSLAVGMYGQGYYWGFHPHDHGGPGDIANINDYARALEKLYPGVAAALDGWSCPVAPPRHRRELIRGDRGEDVREMQGYLGATQDSAFGPATAEAVREWHIKHGVDPRGVWTLHDWGVIDHGDSIVRVEPKRSELIQLVPNWHAMGDERNKLFEEAA